MLEGLRCTNFYDKAVYEIESEFGNIAIRQDGYYIIILGIREYDCMCRESFAVSRSRGVEKKKKKNKSREIEGFRTL